MWNKIVAYAQDFASYLICNLDEKSLKKINNVILFGSVARRTADRKSDVDIFIDTIDESLNKKIDELRREFLNSAKFIKYWKLLGIENDINCIAGKLDNWKDIKGSIISDGITLYGKFVAKSEKERNLVLLTWENVKPNSKRVLLNKRIFGYEYYGKHYLGLIEKYGGERISKGAILVPMEYSKNFIEVFREMKIKVQIREIAERSR